MSHTLFSAPPPATGSTGQTAEQQKLFLILLFVSFMAGKASKYKSQTFNSCYKKQKPSFCPAAVWRRCQYASLVPLGRGFESRFE